MKKSYFVSGKGLKMWFDGSVYQNPDAAAIEEGQRLSKIFKDVKVFKATGRGLKTIYAAITEKELCQQRLAKIRFTPCKRICTC